jgi:hypothetical protein
VRAYSSSTEEEEESLPKRNKSKSNKKPKNSHKFPSPPLAPNFPDPMTLAVASSNKSLINWDSSPLSSEDEYQKVFMTDTHIKYSANSRARN